MLFGGALCRERVVTAMSFCPRRSRFMQVFVTAVVLSGLVPCAFARAGGKEDPDVRSLPNLEVRSLATGTDIRLASSLAGRPAIVLLTGGSCQPGCPVARTAAELQRDYGPWFTWVALLSGEFAAVDLESVRGASVARFDRFYLDKSGAVRASLGIVRLPALLLVDEDGSIHEICSSDGDKTRFAEVARKIQALAAGSRRRRSGFDDFRLPQVGGQGLVSFLDVAGRENTMVAFLNSGNLPCARQLEVLDFVRDRQAGRVSFVAVFLDDATDARIRGFVAAAGVTPDHVLRDPERRLAGRYGIEAVPSLLVIDAAGAIVLSRSGYREEERDALYRDLERALADGGPVAAADPAVREARRMHEEACAFLREGKPEYALLFQERIRELLPGYPSVNLRIAEAALAAGRRDLAIRSFARYLAAEPQTYDSSEVRHTIASLLAPEP